MSLINEFKNYSWISPVDGFEFSSQLESANKCVKIAEKFAIDFYEWRTTTPIKNIEQFTNKEAIKIFKDERGL